MLALKTNTSLCSFNRWKGEDQRAEIGMIGFSRIQKLELGNQVGDSAPAAAKPWGLGQAAQCVGAWVSPSRVGRLLRGSEKRDDGYQIIFLNAKALYKR